MHKIYLILRNNQQTGPYSIEELAQLPLQSKDLVWVEGNSAGWRYPSEITALQHLVPGDNKTPTVSGISQQKPAKKEVTETSPHIYVSLPAVQNLSPTPALLTPEQKLEAKAQALYEKVQAYMQEQAESDTALTTQYARSLEDIKQEYTAWLHQQQRAKKQHHVKYAALTILVFVAIAAFPLINWYRNNRQLPLTDYAVNALPQNADAAQNFTSGQGVTELEKLQQQPALYVTPITETTENPLPEWKQEVPKTFENPFVKKPTSTSKSATTANQKKASVTSPATNAETTAVAAPPVVTTPPAPLITHEDKRVIPLSTLLTLKDEKVFDAKEKYLQLLNITLHNNSSELLPTVAVQVTYFKKDGKEAGREKIVFHNVLANSTQSTTATGPKKAQAVKLRLGTITRADGSLYLVQ